MYAFDSFYEPLSVAVWNRIRGRCVWGPDSVVSKILFKRAVCITNK